MYYVIDTNSLMCVAVKEDAFVLREDLRRDNPDADWQVVTETAPSDAENALERLYALAHQLLTVSKINPLYLEMKLTNLLGEETTFTAMQIMNEARRALDAPGTGGYTSGDMADQGAKAFERGVQSCAP